LILSNGIFRALRKKCLIFNLLFFCIFCAFGSDFYSSEITPDIFARMKGKSYKSDCSVPLSDLRYIHVLHIDVDGRIHEGEMVCNKAIAKDLLEIFKALYEAYYPIERMRLVDDYNADDKASMSANNSSCFNYRLVSGTNVISEHGKGMAVDINPLYNPYVLRKKDGSLHVEPEASRQYVNRNESYDYKIEADDLCCRLFKEHGFSWGGDWTRVKDYQHFEFR